MINGKTFYEILEVEQSASDKEIKKSFRRLSKRYHPDLSTEPSEELFDEVQKSYHVLSQEKLRREYDLMLTKSTVNYSDVYDNLWNALKRGPLITGNSFKLKLKARVEDLVKGKDVKIRYKRKEPCDCNSNQKNDLNSICSNCGGTGRVTNKVTTIIGPVSSVVLCPKCKGSGKDEVEVEHVEGCDGLHKSSTVTVPISLKDKIYNQEYVYEGLGDKGYNGGKDGDLIVIIKPSDDDEYEVDENGDSLDIRKKVSVNMTEYLKGGGLKVEMPSGEMKVVEPKIGKTVVFEGESFGGGDVYVDLKLELDMTSSQREKLLKCWEKILVSEEG